MQLFWAHPLDIMLLRLTPKRSHSTHGAGLLFVWLLCCAAIPSHALETRKMKGPEGALVKAGAAGAANATSSVSGAALLGSVRFFQEWISPIDGPRCSFSPTCSHYGYRAVRDHGSLFGIVLTADRLMRCTIWTEAGRDYQRLPSGKLYDPVVSNLFTQP